jgi:uncharacterized phage-associated protein
MESSVKSSKTNQSRDAVCADYLLRKAHEQGVPDLTPMKIQKLLYFAEGIYLVSNDAKELFDEKFQAWEFGPVLPSIYRRFKSFGRDSVPMDHPFAVPSTLVEGLDESIKAAIESVVKAFGSLKASKLSDMSHAANGPWAKRFDAQKVGVEIDKDEMRIYFKKLLKTETK